MGFVPGDLAAIPVQRLALRRQRLGPFGSGRDAVKFLCVATVGAAVAAVTSALVWVPFLAFGAAIALVHVEGHTLDEYVVGYCRFRWRSHAGTGRTTAPPPAGPGVDGFSRDRPHSVRASGIPIAYLPPHELQHLFDGWRSTLATLDHPVGCRMRGELFSPLPFLPVPGDARGTERAALDSYRELVRALLRNRYRRVVDLAVWDDGSDNGSEAIALRTQLDDLAGALERLGIPARRVSLVRSRRAPSPGVVRS